MKKLLLGTSAILVALATIGAPANAQSVGVVFISFGATVPNGDSAGYGQFIQSNWNTSANLGRGPTSATGSDLIDSTDTLTSVSYSASFGYCDNSTNAFSYSGDTANYGLDADALAANGTETLTISGLDPNAVYTFVGYLAAVNWGLAQDMSISAGGTTDYFTTPVSEVGWVPVTSTTQGSPTVGNVAVFTGLTTSSGDLTVTIAGGDSGNVWGGLSGFQVITSVPEPATLWSVVLGAGCLLGFPLRRSRLFRKA